MDPALREALAALRALGDPTRAFGASKARGMQAFARASLTRVVQLHEREDERWLRHIIALASSIQKNENAREIVRLAKLLSADEEREAA